MNKKLFFLGTIVLLVVPLFAQGEPLKVYVQWATNPVGDWQQTDCAAWADLPKKPVPAKGRGQRDDDLGEDGWIMALNVVGTIIKGWDHYALEPDGVGCRVVLWNDDSEDFPLPWAEEWLFLPPARDSKIEGRYNTRNFFRRYSNDTRHKRPSGEFHPWAEFIPPDESLVRHGAWVSDGLWQRHQTRWSEHDWREWIEGLPAEDIENGRIVREPPRHSAHSVTRFLRDSLQANAAHTAADELAMLSAAGAGETTSENTPVGTDELAVMWTLDEEAGGTWENNAEVRFELSVGDSTADGGFMTVGSSDGHMACVNTGLTSDTEIHTQAGGVFQMTAGVKIASYVGTWTTCNTTDKFEALLAVTCAADHGQCSLTWVYDSDSVVTVPYPAAAAATPKRRMIEW
jgi:hypothetical protein